MRAVVSRVKWARVVVDDEVVGELTQPGLLVLLGATGTDSQADVDWTVRKISELRILRDERSALDEGAGVLVVSQFTLYADVRKGRRPSWNRAAPGPVAQPLVDAVVAGLRGVGVPVATGVFGAMMSVESANDGPFTIWLDSAER